MDILLSSFVKQYINKFNNDQLNALETFLEYEDEIILNYYNFDIDSKEISKNTISKIFKDFRV